MFPIFSIFDFETQLILELGSPSSSHRRVVGGSRLSEYLLREIDDFLSSCEIPLRGVGAIAVNHGPGTFSRLRVILTWAKTVAYFLNIPLLGLDNFRIIDFWLNRWQSLPIAPTHFSLKKYGLDVLGVDLNSLTNSMFLNKLRKNTFRLYFLQPTPHHLLVCPYWEGRPLGKIITAEKWLESLNQYRGVNESTANEGNHLRSQEDELVRVGLGKWLDSCLLENEGFTAAEKQKIQLQIKSQKKLFFLIDELSPDAPIRQSNPLFFSKQNDGLFFILKKELGEISNKKNGVSTPLFSGIIELAWQELLNRSSEELERTAISVNPFYGREFGE